MGYALSSDANLPVEEDVNLYIFMLGSPGWHGDLYEIVERNFDNIAREIGPNAVIVKGLVANYFPEDVRDRFGSFDAFFDSLTAFAKRKNDEFLERFEDTRSLVSQGLDVVDLKPNFFGFGVNINALIDIIRRKRKSR